MLFLRKVFDSGLGTMDFNTTLDFYNLNFSIQIDVKAKVRGLNEYETLTFTLSAEVQLHNLRQSLVLHQQEKLPTIGGRHNL